MKKTGINIKDQNPSIRPQDDFYHFACGNWLKNNPIPKTETKWGSFYILRDENRTRIHKIFKELAKQKNLKKGSDQQLLRDFYRSGMNEKQIERDGLAPLAPELGYIEAATTPEGLLEAIAQLHTREINLLWTPFVTLDEKNSSRMSLYIYQGSLGLPEREYYLSEEDRFVAIRKKYLQHIRKMLELSGTDKKAAKTDAETILAIETQLAQASMSAEQRRDVEKMYNTMSLKELQTLTQINWKSYFTQLGVKKTSKIIVGQLKYMRALNTLLKKVPASDWQAYLRFRLIAATADLLPTAIAEERFKFQGKVLVGLKEMKPRWQRVYGVIDNTITEAIGEEYANRYFSSKAADIMDELIDHIIEVYRERITALDWMSTPTKKKALKKLSTFRAKIGRPTKPRDYSQLTVTPTSYLRNAFNATQFEFAREMNKLNQPVDREEWFIGAHIVNAFYWPNQNEIVFPAGILQPPFFDENADLALNYGAIGAVIGHELTHGFDDKGSLFDHSGNLKNWWTPEDRKAFMKKTKLLEKHYNSFPAVDELFVNGKLTLGENIADLGGVVLAYHALKKHMEQHGRLPDVGGYTPEQRFFFGLVLFERANTNKEAARFLAISDPHAPAYTRVNGPLAHFEPFYEAFNVTAGDGMYRKPAQRANIW